MENWIDLIALQRFPGIHSRVDNDLERLIQQSARGGMACATRLEYKNYL